ncbi:uncharacterized protein LOC132043740 [Lycium ferocissimum]|uniref:uncharacterized protein LOC132043740 n=1 Tax=Lycium ferocissimum TaxID=112874 RepID=UPI00281688AF|nr:uncharacterized protein LOC132043740 [Lycium ferocissimum]
MSKSNFSHVEGVFMKNPLHPEPSPSITKEVQEEAELDIDDIEIDEPVPVASTSSHNTQNTKRVTEREKLLDSEGDDAKPRLRTREEIIAKYRKAGSLIWSKFTGSSTPRIREMEIRRYGWNFMILRMSFLKYRAEILIRTVEKIGRPRNMEV